MYLEPITRKSTIHLSEPSLMEYFGEIPEFSVVKIRRLEHQHFQMIQIFIRHGRTDTDLLLVNRFTKEEEEDSDILGIFQKDHAGHINEFGADHLTGDHENFAPEFRASYDEDEGEPQFKVVYRLLDTGEFHGIFDSDDKEKPPLSQGIYDTGDDENFNLAMVEWEEDWLTAWFGKDLRKDQVSFL